MSIADKLEKLTTDIMSAYGAIESKGGTIPEHKNTDSLPTAIESIEGGGSVEITEYGRLDYYKVVELEFSLSGMECEAEIEDQNVFGAWWNENNKPNDIQYESGEWYFRGDGGQVIIEDFSEIGLSVTLDDPETPFAEIMIEGRYAPDDTGGIGSIVITETDFETLHHLGEYYDTPAPIGDKEIYTVAMCKYWFGPEVTEVGNNFLSGNLYNFFETDTSWGINVQSIGSGFRSGFGSRFYLPELTSLGDYATFNVKTVSFPKLTRIGNYFNAIGADSIILPEVTSIGNNFNAGNTRVLTFQKCQSIGDNFSGLYLNNLTLPEVITIGTSFLKGEMGSGLKGGSRAIRIDFPKVVTIGASFLPFCNYAQLMITFPETITSIGQGLFGACDSLCGSSSSFGSQITVNCPPSVVAGGNVAGNITSQSTRSESLSRMPIYGCGIGFNGTYKNEWASAFPTQVFTVRTNTVQGRKTFVV